MTFTKMVQALGPKATKPSKKGVYLGKINKSLFKSEYLTDGQLNHHVHVVGASGFGKTVMLTHIIKDRIMRGHGLMFIDLKCDQAMIRELTEFIASCGRADDFKVFNLSSADITSYNLLSNGNATQLRDRLMLSLIWSEEYYRNLASSYLLKVLMGLVHLREKGGQPLDVSVLLNAVTYLDFLKKQTQLISSDFLKEKNMMEEAHAFLKDQSNYQSLQGLRTQLESLVHSDFGQKLNYTDSGIELFEAVHQNIIVCMFLDSRRYGEISKVIGRFILQDLKAASARIDAEIPKDQRNPFTVIIDEFADLAQEDFIGFLDRARSSKIGVVVAHQELSDLTRISPEFARRLSGNTSTMYAFLQKGPESAELISGMAGTRSVWKKTMQTKRIWLFDVDAGQASKREVEEFNIHPNVIKSLPVGRCVCIKKYPRAVSYQVEVKS